MGTVIFKAFRGKKSEMPVQYHDGYIYFTTDEGKLYIDAKQDNGLIKRHVINPDYNASSEDTTYTISISDNVITLISSTGDVSTVTLPIYNGGVT